ncbi:aldose reductase [Cryptococcus wingfieldii CBS 7118]|uniref:Aldose reductase n=1 Tax=Cryptococcus wingfieldii CBS 7118 TaxID=1295528 RepID=A0A1E3K237_9TREE|nr:aldose reductase [Cryptococcus wingfieldii CBS 7118]ODO07234.1 aldose reductase [Cryptococcus wingfieldii CBS 7118]
MVRTIKLSDGKTLRAIGWGSGSGGIKGKDNNRLAIDAGVHALNANIRHIDTAQAYETEEATGLSIKEAGVDRSEVFVTTKISGTVANNKEAIKENVLGSIELLGFKPDLLLIHNPFVVEDGNIAKFWTSLEELVKDGTLEGVSLGVSNFRPQDLEAVLKIATIKPVVNQIEFHPYVLVHLEPVLKIAKEHGIVIEAYGPLTPVLRHPTGGPLKPVLERIAQRLSKDAGKELDSTAVLLLWTIQSGVVVITTSKNEERIKGLAALDSVPDLTAEELKEITDVGKTHHFRYYSEHMTEDFPDPDLPTVDFPKRSRK